MNVIYVVYGTKYQAEELKQGLAGNWYILGQKSPYKIIEETTPIRHTLSKKDRQIIRDNLDVEDKHQ